MNLILIRDLRDPDRNRFTLGRLTVGAHQLHTMERGWVPNPDGGRSGARFVSCVAPGIYRLVRHDSERYPLSWALVNPALDVYHLPDDVPAGREAQARVAILLHAGNYWDDFLGCIGPGRTRTWTTARTQAGEWMVTHSRDALNLIKTVVGARLDLMLEIRWADGLAPEV